MRDTRTKPLPLAPAIVTGNIKAAASAAGAKSADFWMMPYAQLHYDPLDNIRPVDHQWVQHLCALIVANGYDKSAPLHCYARKVDDENLFYVYKGQHRYLAIGMAIQQGIELDHIPVVVREAKTVNRVDMVIDGYNSNESKRASPLELAAVIAELRELHRLDVQTICKRLNITEQTIRDTAWLEKAPTELLQLVRNSTVSGTLAIEQIRRHGADKALERLRTSAAHAAAAGKTRVTKKHLSTSTVKSSTPRPKKISERQTKQFLQTLQTVLHDVGFNILSLSTKNAVRAALAPLAAPVDTAPTPKSESNVESSKNAICKKIDGLDNRVANRTKLEQAKQINGPSGGAPIARPRLITTENARLCGIRSTQ